MADKTLNKREKIFLITNNLILPARISKWVYPLLGFVFWANGLSNIVRGGTFGIILAVLFFIAGFYLIIYSFMAFSKNSKYAPGLRFNQDFIEFKEGVLKPATRIPWDSIKSIMLESFRIRFDMGKERKVFVYRTNPKISIAIKHALREMAEKKHIEVLP